MTTGDAASRNIYTLGNILTNWYSVTCATRGYIQSAWWKMGKTQSAFGPAHHVGNYRYWYHAYLRKRPPSSR